MATAFPAAKLIPDPYNIESTSSLYLANGYGIQFGAGENAKDQLSCYIRLNRAIVVVQTRLVATTEHNATSQSNTALALLEDQLAMIKIFETNGSLGSIIADIQYLNDTGIEFLETADSTGRFYVLTTAFTGTYLENLNA